MKKNALLYVKGLTEAEAQSDIKNVKRYCSENELEIAEILFDESRDDEKDYDCMKVLYNQMKSKGITTIIFDSCYYYYPLASSISHMSRLTDIEVIRFHNGELQTYLNKSKMKETLVINQSMFDKELTVDFGNWIGSLSKDRKDVLYIDREEHARLVEKKQKDREKAIKENRKDKGVRNCLR